MLLLGSCTAPMRCLNPAPRRQIANLAPHFARTFACRDIAYEPFCLISGSQPTIVCALDSTPTANREGQRAAELLSILMNAFGNACSAFPEGTPTGEFTAPIAARTSGARRSTWRCACQPSLCACLGKLPGIRTLRDGDVRCIISYRRRSAVQVRVRYCSRRVRTSVIRP